MRYADTRRLRRQVTEIANPALRLETVRRIRARIQDELEDARSEDSRLTSAFRNMGSHPGQSSPELFKLRGLRFLAFLLVALDIPVQLLLNTAAFPDIESWKVAAGSFGVALGITGAVHPALVHLVHDPDRPARTIRLCKSLAATAFVATSLGATVFLFARQASPDMAARLVTLTAISIWTVAEALPLSAGFFSAWAHVLAEPVHAERALRRVRVLIRGHETFHERLEEEERRLLADVVTEGTAHGPEHGTVVTRAAGSLAMLLALIAGDRPLSAQPAPDPLQRTVCAVFADRTLSVDPVHREEGLRLLTEGLPDFLENAGCTELLAGTFVDEGAWAPRSWFPVPAHGSASCEPTDVPTGTAGVLANMRGFRDHFRQEAEEACRAKRSEADEAYDEERTALLQQVGAVFRAPQLTGESRTDIAGLIESLMAADVRLSLILTDAIDTAHENGIELSVEPGRRVVLLLVPARREYGGREETQRAAELWRETGVETLPYVALTSPSGWERLVQTLEP